MIRHWIAAMAAIVPATAAGAQTSWSGVYVGAEGGVANARLRVSGTDAIFQLSNERPGPGGTSGPIIVVPSTSRDFAGRDRDVAPLYGALAGAQLQIGTFVAGIEGDVHGGREAGRFSVEQTIPTTLLAPASTATLARELRSRYDWAARARLGIATGNSLLYAAGGIAQTRLRLTGEDSFLTPAGPAAASTGSPAFQSPTIGPVVVTYSRQFRLTGWTAGFGGERRIGRHFSLGLDARYVDFGSRLVNFGCGFISARQGSCGSYATPPIVINGRTHGITDTTPGAEPGPTRVSLSEWRLAARLIFRF